jgi:hypothetical protein
MRRPIRGRGGIDRNSGSTDGKDGSGGGSSRDSSGTDGKDGGNIKDGRDGRSNIDSGGSRY